jgi:hypothetical protein
MIKLYNILLQEKLLDIYSIDVLIKTDKTENKVGIYNHIRALQGVVVVKVEQNAYLDAQATDQFEYSLLHVKYTVSNTPEEDIKKIKTDAMLTHKVDGLLQFIPRFKTIKKVGEY